jgi:hypothetical protein
VRSRVLLLTRVLLFTFVALLALIAVGCTTSAVSTTAAPTTAATSTQTVTTHAVVTTTAPTVTTSPTTLPLTTSPPTTGLVSSTTTTGLISTTTTEALSSAETRQADGTIKGMGFIDKVWEQGGKRYLSIDYAEMLTGDAARQAALADGQPEPEDDYYIRNENPKKREFVVSPSVMITTATRAGGPDQPATWAEFLSFWGPTPPEDAQHLYLAPWWIVREGDTVISIAEQYLP